MMRLVSVTFVRRTSLAHLQTVSTFTSSLSKADSSKRLFSSLPNNDTFANHQGSSSTFSSSSSSASSSSYGNQRPQTRPNNVKRNENSRKVAEGERTADQKKLRNWTIVKTSLAKKNEESSMMLLACMNNNIDIVNMLLQTVGPSLVNEATNLNVTPLMFAAKNQSLEMIQLLCKNGADVSFTDSNGWTALFHAAAGQDLNCFIQLIAFGSNISLRLPNGHTVLHTAIHHNSVAIVDYILTNSMVPIEDDKSAFTPLIHAIARRKPQCVKLLLDHGADVNALDSVGRSTLYNAFHHHPPHSTNFNIIEMILRHPQLNHEALSSGLISVLKSPVLLRHILKKTSAETLVHSNLLLKAVEHNKYDLIDDILQALDFNKASEGSSPSEPHRKVSPVVERQRSNLLIQALSKAHSLKNDLIAKKILDFVAANSTENPLVMDYARVQILSAQIASMDMSVIREALVNFDMAKINQRSIDGSTILIEAVTHLNDDEAHEVTSMLISMRANVNKHHEETDVSPLMIAVEKNKRKTMDLLIDSGANINFVNAKGSSALKLAIQSADLALFQHLISRGAIVYHDDPMQKVDALSVAATVGVFEIVKYILKHYREPALSFVHPNGWNPLICASQSGCLKTFELLTDYFPLFSVESGGWNSLMVATHKGHTDIVQFILNNAESAHNFTDALNYLNKSGQSVLTVAALFNRPLIAQILLAYGADPNICDNQGWTPLMAATVEGNVESAIVLASHPGNDINNINNFNQTVLSIAASKGNLVLVDHFLSHRHIEVNIPEGFRTPLFMAVINGHIEVVKRLVSSGKAEIEVYDERCFSPTILAARHGNIAILDYLISCGGSLKTWTINGWTAMFYAVHYGHYDLVRHVLTHHLSLIDQGHLSVNGLSLLDCAIAAQRHSIAILLKRSGFSQVAVSPSQDRDPVLED